MEPPRRTGRRARHCHGRCARRGATLLAAGASGSTPEGCSNGHRCAGGARRDHGPGVPGKVAARKAGGRRGCLLEPAL
eukprot:6183907-Alexandrium_andersonii.AAC.1